MPEPESEKSRLERTNRQRRYVIVAYSLLGLVIIAWGSFYWKYARMVDRKLAAGAFSRTIDIYADSPPLLVMNVSLQGRETRRIVPFSELPKPLVDAVVSVEDKRFFRHEGFDPLRMIKAAYVDLRDGRREQGASTLSMQLARSLLLVSDKKWGRKIAEFAIAMRLEQKLSKRQIFEYYCNQVYLGRLATYSLHGFGAAAHAYFDKDVRDLTLPEAATLAGLIQRPSYYHPWGNLDRLRDRRNLVLAQMLHAGCIGQEDYERAVSAPLKIAPEKMDRAGAPYFVDLVADELRKKAGDSEAAGAAQKVSTTLDLKLQRVANDAVRTGMQGIDKILRDKSAQAQVALVALDPHTGEVKALVGGRDYAASQLNHVLAERQPGSAFKPFVYAAALNTALLTRSKAVTPATLIVDQPTTFWVGSAAYQPSNFGHSFSGEVTVRQALARSVNVASVKLAEMAGYAAVCNLARSAGLGDKIQPTPSIALGAYEADPLDLAGAFTIFSNSGVYVRPSLIKGAEAPETRRALDERVTFLMVSLMEGVVNYGTGAGARARGFTVPAAGKTGTSRDGWFAGFTSRLLCVVWVGFDDNRELTLEGANSALPIWTEFMKRALELPSYRDAKPFRPPAGISSANIDPDTGMLAGPECPSSRIEFFIAGTEPRQICDAHAFVGR